MAAASYAAANNTSEKAGNQVAAWMYARSVAEEPGRVTVFAFRVASA